MSVTEIRAELSQIVSGRVALADGVIPPLTFVTVNAIAGLQAAAVAGMSSALLITIWRFVAGRPIRFAVAGLVGTAVAAAFALRSGSPESYFLPGIVSGGVTTALILWSIAAGRPFVAFASWLTRGWPLSWYWHPQVRPAYMRASWLWAGFFGLKTASQLILYSAEDTVTLGLVRALSGWPALILLLVATYRLGRKWLEEMEGPSVDEHESGIPPPWVGQPRGF